MYDILYIWYHIWSVGFDIIYYIIVIYMISYIHFRWNITWSHIWYHVRVIYIWYHIWFCMHMKYGYIIWCINMMSYLHFIWNLTWSHIWCHMCIMSYVMSYDNDVIYDVMCIWYHMFCVWHPIWYLHWFRTVQMLLQVGSNAAPGLFKCNPIWIRCRPCSSPAGPDAGPARHSTRLRLMNQE